VTRFHGKMRARGVIKLMNHTRRESREPLRGGVVKKDGGRPQNWQLERKNKVKQNQYPGGPTRSKRHEKNNRANQGIWGGTTTRQKEREVGQTTFGWQDEILKQERFDETKMGGGRTKANLLDRKEKENWHYRTSKRKHWMGGGLSSGSVVIGHRKLLGGLVNFKKKR